MIALTAVLIAGLAAPPQQAREPRAPQTDQTIAVTRGTRLLIDSFAGDVIIRASDRDSLRVQARHTARARVNIRTVPGGLRVSSSSEHGPAGAVDYDITAPAWMAIKVDGHFNFVAIEGMQSEVSVQTNRGDIIVKGGNGVTAKSVGGHVTVEGARGKTNVSSVNEGITIDRASGEVLAETVNGPIALSGIDAAMVEAGTVNGRITYDGTAVDGGRYRLTTHNGSITVSVPESSNATFSVRTYNGSFNSNLPVKGEGDVRRGRRVTYTLGNGSAEFELESFGGGIRLRKPGTATGDKK